MRRLLGLVATSLLAILVALAATAPPASAGHGPIQDGDYYYTDITDRSNLDMWIRGNNGTLSVYDDAGSVCRDAGLGFVPAFYSGRMVETGTDTWDVTADIWCQSKAGWVVVIPSLTISYELGRDGHSVWDHTGQPFKKYPTRR